MTVTTDSPTPARLRVSDLARLAVVGLRTRKLRAALSALGIAIGVAAIVAVLGLSSSSAAGLNDEIAALGTNLLTVQPGNNFAGSTEELPLQAPAMISRLPGVYAVQTTGTIDGVSVYRSPLIPTVNTNALSVAATSLHLPGTAGTSLAQGTFLNAATAHEPVCVLGAAAAQLLGIDHVFPGERVWAGNMWLYVAGILKPDVLSPDVDSSVLVGYPFAAQNYGFDGHPTTIYVKATDSRVTAVDSLLGAQTDPEDPEQPGRVGAVLRAGRAGRCQGGVQHPVPRAGCGRAAGRRYRGGQHHGHCGTGTAQRDRAAPRARRDPGAHPDPVPDRSGRAGPDRRDRRGGCRGSRHHRLRTHQRLGRGHSGPGVAGGLAAAVLIGALAGLLPALKAARLSPTEALWTL